MLSHWQMSGERTATNSSYTKHYRRQRGRALNQRPGTTAAQSTNTRQDANYRHYRHKGHRTPYHDNNQWARNKKRLVVTGSSSTGDNKTINDRALLTRPKSTRTRTSSSEDRQKKGAPKKASVNTEKREL